MPKRRLVLESKGEREFRSYVADLGYLCLKLWAFSIVGIPDRIIIGPGRFVLFLEFKKRDTTPTPKQLRWIARLREWGFFADWAQSYEEAVEVFNVYRRKHSPPETSSPSTN